VRFITLKHYMDSTDVLLDRGNYLHRQSQRRLFCCGREPLQI